MDHPNVQFNEVASFGAEPCPLTPATTFQEAFLGMDWEAALTLAGNETERRILALAQTSMLSSAPLSRSVLPFPGSKKDSLLNTQWGTLCQAYFWLRNDYEAGVSGIDTTTASLSYSFTRIPGAEKTTYARDRFDVPLHHSGTNSPIVDVVINGKPYRFWLDSGAGVSVVSSRVAKATGIHPLSDRDFAIGTSTSRKVSAGPSFIESMVIGDLAVNNHPCVIMDKRDLSFRLLGVRIFKIDGIIGWPLLKQLDLEMDIKGEKLTIRKPVPQPTKAGNLGWFWQPFLQCQTANGCTLNLQIDTGSSSTFFYPSSYPKLSQKPTQGGKTMRGGAGGSSLVSYEQLDSCRFVLDGTEVSVRYAEGYPHPPSAEELFVFDGVLGQNILAKGKFRMDFVNRRFVFVPTPAD